MILVLYFGTAEQNCGYRLIPDLRPPSVPMVEGGDTCLGVNRYIIWTAGVHETARDKFLQLGT